MQIFWNDHVLAESEDVLVVGTECYVPEECVDMALLQKNTAVAYCSDKGYGECYDIVLPAGSLSSGAWRYPHPYTPMIALKGRIGFKRTMLRET